MDTLGDVARGLMEPIVCQRLWGLVYRIVHTLVAVRVCSSLYVCILHLPRALALTRFRSMQSRDRALSEVHGILVGSAAPTCW